MLTFLRKIRKSLIEAGSTKRYLLYAIGEIALVVIGILIALQINNWNEWRKDRSKEKVIIEDLVKNIELNIKIFKDDILFLEDKNQSAEIILNTLEQKLSYSDTLAPHFHNARIAKKALYLSNIGFQALKDAGLDILTNKSLSDEIVKLYEFTLPSIMSSNSNINTILDEFDNYVVVNFKLTEGAGLKPNDYEELLKDQYYYSWIDAFKEGRKYLIEVDHEMVAECEQMLDAIKDSLN